MEYKPTEKGYLIFPSEDDSYCIRICKSKLSVEYDELIRKNARSYEKFIEGFAAGCYSLEYNPNDSVENQTVLDKNGVFINGREYNYDSVRKIEQILNLKKPKEIPRLIA